MESIEALKARLEESNARTAKATAQLEETEAEKLEAEVVAAEREAALVEALAEAVATHGRRKVAAVRTAAGHIVVTCPTSTRWRAFIDAESFATKALEDLVRGCVAFPDRRELARIFDEVPAALERTAAAITDLAQGRTKELAGKS